MIGDVDAFKKQSRYLKILFLLLLVVVIFWVVVAGWDV